MEFNEDEKKLLRLISNLEPYDVMKIAIDPWGRRMSVRIQSTKSESYDFEVDRKSSMFGTVDKRS